MNKTIKTIAPSKGGLVKGHKVYAFFTKAPAVPGTISATNASGLEVVFEIDPILVAFGLPRRTKWTWRNKTGTYQQKGTASKPGVCLGLVQP